MNVIPTLQKTLIARTTIWHRPLRMLKGGLDIECHQHSGYCAAPNRVSMSREFRDRKLSATKQRRQTCGMWMRCERWMAVLFVAPRMIPGETAPAAVSGSTFPKWKVFSLLFEGWGVFPQIHYPFCRYIIYLCSALCSKSCALSVVCCKVTQREVALMLEQWALGGNAIGRA